jgi:hypothetical protein
MWQLRSAQGYDALGDEAVEQLIPNLRVVRSNRAGVTKHYNDLRDWIAERFRARKHVVSAGTPLAGSTTRIFSRASRRLASLAEIPVASRMAADMQGRAGQGACGSGLRVTDAQPFAGGMTEPTVVIRRQRSRMADIIQFPSRAEVAEEESEIDLLTAVDAAIRDLRDISRLSGDQAARVQADECRRMLERAFNAAV